MAAEQIHFFLHLRDQIKLYHWQTRVYARHIATDKVGKYGRSKVSDKNAVITLHNLTEAGAVRLVNSSIKYLQGPLTKVLKGLAGSEDLANIRDEMVADLNQLLYLFTLK